MDLKLLREATRPEHEATEAAVPLMEPGLTRERYADVLKRFHGVICAWETFADTEAPCAYVELVERRGRRSFLEEDLHFFGKTWQTAAPAELLVKIRALVMPNGASSDTADAGSRFLGTMYVIEGSTLGGRYIASHVEKVLGLTPGCGDRFFRGYEDETMPLWRDFQQSLLAVPEDQGQAVIAAAKGMFHMFGSWISRKQNASQREIP